MCAHEIDFILAVDKSGEVVRRFVVVGVAFSHATPAQTGHVRLCFMQYLQTWRKRCAPFIEWYSSASSILFVPIISLQARLAANLSQLVMRAGEAAPHRVIANQQQEVIPADGCGSVGLVVRCPK